jgi:predicted component of type VI protein secretion system
MRAILALVMLTVALTTAGCSSNEEPEEEEPPMKVEDTVFGDLIGTQDKARDRSNAAVELHRESLNKRLEEDEGAPTEEPAGD